MAASPYTKMGDVMYNCEYQLGQFPVLIPLQLIITAYRVANTSISDIDMTADDVLKILRALTGCTVGTGITANCYPRGIAETTCFDLDGNELP
jgi:hypothetical protein